MEFILRTEVLKRMGMILASPSPLLHFVVARKARKIQA